MRKVPLVPVALAFVVLVALTGGLWRAERLWYRHCQPKVYMTVCLSDIPTNLGDVAVCEGNVMKINNMQRCGDIRLYFRNDTLARTLRYGDTLLLHGYPDILRRSIYLTSDHYIVIARDSTSLRAHSEALRRRLLQRMQDGPLRDCSVAEALALGWKGGIDHYEQFVNNFGEQLVPEKKVALAKFAESWEMLISKGIKRQDLLLIHDILQASTDATSKPDSSQPTKG